MEVETPDITLYGGTYLGKGQYGCTITPPLLCKGQSRLTEKERYKAAKVLEPDDAKHEIAIANELRKIPMSKNYFVYSDKKSACEPAPLTKQLNANGKIRSELLDPAECKSIIRSGDLSYYKMYTMPFGGVSYEKKLGYTNFNYWEFGKHLLEGLSLLLVHGIVHMDLHSNNVLMDDYMVPRIIDWGTATQGPFATWDELSIITRRRFALRYTQEPPEVPLFVAAYNGRPSIDSAIDLMFEENDRKFIITSLQLITNLDPRMMKEQLNTFRNKTLYLERDINYMKWWKAHWHTYDTWSLGVILLKVLRELMNQTPRLLDKPEYSDKKQNIKETLRGMCDFNCFERMNAVQALAKWDSPNNPIVRRFGSKWL